MGENDKEGREVMDTPERSKNNEIATSINKFEDSPVFNFLNSLSPIKPVTSMLVSQTINTFCFGSLPSIFASPHVSALKESRFLQSHQLQDLSKPEFSSDDGNIDNTNRINLVNTKKPDEHKENLVPRASYDCSKQVVEFAENFNYGSNSSTLAPFVEDEYQRGLYRSEVNVEGVSEIDHNKEAASCDWESLIADVPNFLIFESPSDTQSYEKSVDPATSFYQSIKNAIKNTQQVGEGSECENLSTLPREGSEMMDSVIAGSSLMNPGENMDYELSGLYRGMRRRCLIFEMAEARRKQFEENSVSDPPMLLRSDGSTSSSQQLVAPNTGNNPSRRALPGIGLHLNALATTPKNYKIVDPEASTSGRLLIRPSPSADFHSQISAQESLSNTLVESSLEIEIDTLENSVLNVENPMPNDEINQSSPKNKKRRVEQAGEAEACKRCNCKKSKCLKLYCECFAAGVYCVEPCACIDCFNKPIHENTVLETRKQIESRNPLAFTPKVIRASDSLSEIGDDFSKTPASARHKRGCNCKKSGCLKKYCECYQGGVGCSINCRCEGCKNMFGRKDGMDAETEDDETDTTEKDVLDSSFQKTMIRNDLEPNMDSAPPAMPLRTGRQLVQQPLSSKNKPPRFSFPSISSSSVLPTSQATKRSNFIAPQPKFNHLETVNEDEMPEFLQVGSPISSIKSLSPNGKRVSPPQHVNLSPGFRSSRKLILRSIPSFPSLSHNQ